MSQSTTHTALTRLGQLSDQDLGSVLALASVWAARWMQPEVSVHAYVRHLEALVKDAQRYVADDTDDVDLALEAVRQILSRRYGYSRLDDPSERHLAASVCLTIDRRRGSSMALSILYTHVLKALGWTTMVLDFPPRALVAVMTPKGRRILDPSDGREMTARDLRAIAQQDKFDAAALQPGGMPAISARAVVLDLFHDIKVHHLRHNAPEAALHAIEGALLIAPEAVHLWRELGLLHERLDHISDAIFAFEQVLRLPGGDAHRYIASQKVQSLRRRQDASDI